MRYLAKNEAREAEKYINLAAKVAKKSVCKKSQIGVVIVKDGVTIGEGCNNPPHGRICDICLRENIQDNSRIELCYAVHAEQNAIINALKEGYSLEGSRLYHVKIKNGEKRVSGEPSCTMCSKLILETGISEVVLLYKDGFGLYSAEEFNDKSFEYFVKNRGH